jgi:D5 N terminal like
MTDASDEALALRFADLHADEMRFVAAWGKWLTFDGAVWSFDDTERPVNDKKGRLAYGQSRADFPTD